jgi:hypothetical protein
VALDGGHEDLAVLVPPVGGPRDFVGDLGALIAHAHLLRHPHRPVEQSINCGPRPLKVAS